VDPDGDLWAVGDLGSRIEQFSSAGQSLSVWTSAGDAEGKFLRPRGVALDGSGNTYVVDSGNYRIQKFDVNGVSAASWGSQGTGPGQFANPLDIAVEGATVYVLDDGLIETFDTDGGNYRTTGVDPQPGYEHIAVGSGYLYVTDRINRKVLRFDLTDLHDIPTVLEWGVSGTGDGEFLAPVGIAVDTSNDGCMSVMPATGASRNTAWTAIISASGMCPRSTSPASRWTITVMCYSPMKS